ncbi:MAG: tetratricopeptide repeat protein [Chloroflexi bacterium]|nr:tetratricopeptide repeat protein [Chloroflexota bacterium]
MTWAKFRQAILESFNTDELRTLCFDLRVDFENLPGEGKNSKVRELISLLERQDRLPELIAALQASRPQTAWETVLQNPQSFAQATQDKRKLYLAAAAGFVLLVVVVALLFIFMNQANKDTAEPVAESLSTAVIPTNAPPPTASPTIAATETAVSPVQPVQPGEFMVLVAELEQIGGEDEDVTRFIADNLQQTLEVGLPFSNVRIRRYPEVITSAEEAKMAAAQAGAPVIVWGNSANDLIELEVQVGDYETIFPDMPFDRDILEQTANVRIQLADARQESVAAQVMAVLNVLSLADGNLYQTMEMIAVQDQLVGNLSTYPIPSVGSYVQQYGALFFDDPEMALTDVNAALELDGANPLLYIYRGWAYFRLDDLNAARLDFETADRLSADKPEWISPAMYKALLEIALLNHEQALVEIETALQQRPDDWFALFLKGVTISIVAPEDTALALEFLEKSIANNPKNGWPHQAALLISMRDGRLPQAIQHMNTLLTDFPDPAFANRIGEAVGITEFVGSGLASSALSHMVLGQYDRVLTDLDELEQLHQEEDLTALLLGNDVELFFMRGFAHCNLGELEEAEAAYTAGLETNPDYTILYLFRAEVRHKQGNATGAAEDLSIINKSDLELGFDIEQISAALESGLFDCAKLFTPAP